MRDIEQADRNAMELGTLTMYNQTIEECSELILAISKFKRAKGFGQPTEIEPSEARANLMEEIVDVQICLDGLITACLKVLPGALDHIYNEKVERTKKRLEGIYES